MAFWWPRVFGIANRRERIRQRGKERAREGRDTKDFDSISNETF